MSAAELAARARTIAADTKAGRVYPRTDRPNTTRLELLAEVVAELAELNVSTDTAADAAITAIDALHTNRAGEGEELDHCYHCMWPWPCPTRQIITGAS